MIRAMRLQAIGLLASVAISVATLPGAGASTLRTPAAPDSASGTDITALDRRTGVLLERLAEGRMSEALALSRAMVRENPTYRLAQLVYAELLSVEALDAVRPVALGDWSEEFIDLLLEARTRLAIRQAESEFAMATTDTVTEAGVRRATAASAPVLPRALVRLGDDVSDVIMVDLSRSELRHYRSDHGQARLIARHYVSSGSAGFGKWREGDRRTPLGVYRIETLHPDGALPELYGAAALTLDYPNALDRELGRTGYGIWLHGVPRANPSRAPWSSEGCVTMSNQHLLRLADGLDLERTVVVLSDRIDDVSAQTREALAMSYQDEAGAAAGQTLIEVPSRGATTHLAVLDDGLPPQLDLASGTAPSSVPGPSRWRFVPVSKPALASNLPTSP